MKKTETCRQAALDGEKLYTAPDSNIAILLASYNGARYLEEQLESLRKQTHQAFTCYIHDDGSNDGTQEIIEAYCEQYPEHFIYLGSFRTGGAKNNFLYMLKNVSADYYMFCDQDDVWLSEKIEKTYQKMREEESKNRDGCPICVFSDVAVVDEKLNVIRNSRRFKEMTSENLSLRSLLYLNQAAGCTQLINRTLRNMAVNGEADSLIWIHDWFISCLAAAAGKYIFINEPLMFYRQHTDNEIGAIRKQRTIRDKLGNLLIMKQWIARMRKMFSQQKNNANAVLICMEADENIVTGAQTYENMKVVKKFIKQQNAPLIVKLVRFYWWKSKQ